MTQELLNSLSRAQREKFSHGSLQAAHDQLHRLHFGRDGLLMLKHPNGRMTSLTSQEQRQIQSAIAGYSAALSEHEKLVHQHSGRVAELERTFAGTKNRYGRGPDTDDDWQGA
mgnify:CR=1 FL=1